MTRRCSRLTLWLLLLCGVLLLLSSPFGNVCLDPLQSDHSSAPRIPSLRELVLPTTPRDARKPLVIIKPFTSADLNNTLEQLSAWSQADVSPACSKKLSGLADLVFYYPREPDAFSETFLDIIRAHFPAPSILDCFGSVSFVHAHLTPEEDTYPGGPSIMFFRIFTGQQLEEIRSKYDFMFWSEWDVFPSRPRWLDLLVAKAFESKGSLWMVGSMYVGPAFNVMSANVNARGWVGHINGNSLCCISCPEFNKFISLVVSLEDPGAYWKPFDVSIWRVLHDWPYTWRYYQLYRMRFAHSNLILNCGFTISPDCVQRAKEDPFTALIHGNPSSAGVYRLKEKFHGGKPIAQDLDNAVEWSGDVAKRDNISLLLSPVMDSLGRTSDVAVSVTQMALKSMSTSVKGAVETIVLYPSLHHAKYDAVVMGNFNHRIPVNLGGEDASLNLARKLFNADEYCSGAHIILLAPWTRFSRNVKTRDFFWGGKPLMRFTQGTRYAHEDEEYLARVQINANGDVVQPLRRRCTDFVLEFTKNFLRLDSNESFCFRSGFPVAYPRYTFVAFRDHVNKIHGKPFQDAITTSLPAHLSLKAAFEIVENALAAFMYKYHRDSVYWASLDGAVMEHRLYPLTPFMGCFASWLPKELEKASQIWKKMTLQAIECNRFNEDE